MLQGKLADVGANFKEVLEVRTKNIQASRSRTENFVSSVSSKSQVLDPQRSDSPLYNPSGRRTPQPGFQGASSDLLTLDPSNPSPLGRPSFQTDQQLLVMEEAQTNNTYIQARGEAIDAIERTISELGGIFGQLAQMVSEQSEMIQRIDANTEDVVDNVEGAQRELMKYWSRVSGNRWLIAKMFGVLMVRFSLLDAVAGANETMADFLPSLGFDSRIDIPLIFFLMYYYGPWPLARHIVPALGRMLHIFLHLNMELFLFTVAWLDFPMIAYYEPMLISWC
jgi:syntaxin 5